MIFRGLFILIFLQIYQESGVSAFDRDQLEKFVRERNEAAKATDGIDPRIQTLIQELRTNIIADLKKELEIVSKDVKSYQKRSLIATSDFLKKMMVDEIKPVKELLISLNAVKNIFHEELTKKVRSSIKEELAAFQRTELDSLVIEVKNEIVELIKTESGGVKTSLSLEVASIRDVLVNQTTAQSENMLVNQQADGVIRELEEKCQVKKLIGSVVESLKVNHQAVDLKLEKLEEGVQNLTLAQSNLLQAKTASLEEDDSSNHDKELVDLLEARIGKLVSALKPNASDTCELKSSLEVVKTSVEAIKSEQDARSEELTSKLVDKIEKLESALKLDPSDSSELKSTVESIKTSVEAIESQQDARSEELTSKLVDKIEKLESALKVNPSDSCELKSTVELIKTSVEAIKSEQDGRSEKLISKLVDRIGRLLTVKLKYRGTCELSKAVRTTLASIKAATDSLVETAATSAEENKLEEKFEALLTELNANTTTGISGVNSKLDKITKTADSLGKSFGGMNSSIQGTLAAELDKFSGKQLGSIKTAVGDVLETAEKKKVTELGGKDGSKSVEMGKLKTIEGLLKGTVENVKIELGKVEERILKAFNETIVDRFIANGKNCEGEGEGGEHSGRDKGGEHSGEDKSGEHSLEGEGEGEAEGGDHSVEDKSKDRSGEDKSGEHSLEGEGDHSGEGEGEGDHSGEGEGEGEHSGEGEGEGDHSGEGEGEGDHSGEGEGEGEGGDHSVEDKSGEHSLEGEGEGEGEGGDHSGEDKSGEHSLEGEGESGDHLGEDKSKDLSGEDKGGEHSLEGEGEGESDHLGEGKGEGEGEEHSLEGESEGEDHSGDDKPSGEEGGEHSGDGEHSE